VALCQLFDQKRTGKFKQTQSIAKIIAGLFWDRKDNLLIDFLRHGKTIIAHY
jgi:hypothetical protein